MSVLGDAGADLGKVQGHHGGIGSWPHQRRARATRGADRAEQVGPGILLVPRRDRTRAALGSDAGERALLTNSSLVLPSELEGLSASVL